MEVVQKLFSTRRGTVVVGAFAAVLAGIVLLVYLSHYRNSLKGSTAEASVLVARNLIQKGTPGDVIGSTSQFQVSSLPKNQLRDGALTDPASLRGLVAAGDIYPGQQLTAAEFVPATTNGVLNKLSGAQRAVAIPFDSAHGLLSEVQPGNHVDVYVGLNLSGVGGTRSVLKLLMQDALVLRTPGSGGALSGGGGSNVVLRADATQAAALAFAADNGKLWLVLRPASGAQPPRPGLMTIQRLLLGVQPAR